jgi:glutamate/tyrosine decarboxylase-like PLP-dependent enzyme
MFGVKTKIINRLKKNFYNINFNSLTSSVKRKTLALLVKSELERELQYVDIQQPIAKKTNHFASYILKKTTDYMPNNLGNWSIKKPGTLSGKLELTIIETLKKQYNCNKEIVGHFGSGTTEGNIYAAWIGRNYLSKKLKSKNFDKLILIKSSLSHYSLDKASDIIGIKNFEVSIDQTKFNLDLAEFELIINKLYKRGYRGFLVPLTLGYTVTGTDDDYLAIIKIVEKFKKEKKDCEFFIWLDAAFTGISKIFDQKKFEPFKNKQIQLLSTDLHKFLAVPYPASVLLYRKNLLKHVAKPIPYIDQLDSTLLGSRSGNMVIASWFTLINLNHQKMRKLINESLKEKENYLDKIVKEKIKVTIINNKNSLQACLISHNKKADEILSKKYGLSSIEYPLLIKNKTQVTKIYKLYFFTTLR